MRSLWLENPPARRREISLREKRLGIGAGGGAAERPGGEPSPPLASAASRRVGPCTRSVVQRSCTGGPGAASASVRPAGEPTRSAAALHQPQPRRPREYVFAKDTMRRESGIEPAPAPQGLLDLHLHQIGVDLSQQREVGVIPELGRLVELL